MTPHNDADSILLYELYDSAEAFDLHWNGPSVEQVRKEAAGLSLSLTGTRCELIESLRAFAGCEGEWRAPRVSRSALRHAGDAEDPTG